MLQLKELKESFLHLLFPHTCAGCGSDLLNEASLVCMRCMAALPETNFAPYPDNPAEKIFRGRIPVENAMAAFYFTKESLMQHLVHQFKYKGNKELGLQLGRLLGKYIIQSNRFSVDALVPLPLFPVKERKRGYNQATVLCEGMAEIMNVPVLINAIVRSKHTEPQTKKGRVERWQNMEGKFVVNNSSAIVNKHVLLVDDVVTTGATLESCGIELLKAADTTLSIATLCIAS
jgi:ComF family protein